MKADPEKTGGLDGREGADRASNELWDETLSSFFNRDDGAKKKGIPWSVGAIL